MARIFAVVNQKGGVGKTTTSVNLAASFAGQGYRTLLIDSDAQAHSCKSIGFNPEKTSANLYTVLNGKEKIEKSIHTTDFENLWIVPSDISLSATEVELATKTGKEYYLQRALDKIKDKFDFIIIDCPPFLGVLTINALIASTDVLVTCTMSYLSLEGVSDLLDLVEVINDTLYLPNKVKITGVLACMYDDRTKMSRRVRKELERYFGDTVYNVTIPVNVAINEAQTKGIPIIHHAPESKGAHAYRRLSMEILRRNGMID
jgi:chromosome partitioning protein